MKYPRECEIWRACSKKGGRFPNVTLRDGQLMATDGRIMAVVWVSDPAGVASENIPIEALKAARRLSKKGESAELYVSGRSNENATDRSGISYPEPEGPECPDPHVILDAMDGAEPSRAFALNAKLLFELSKALGNDQLKLEVFDDPNVIRVNAINDEGKLMLDRYGLIHPVDPK